MAELHAVPLEQPAWHADAACLNLDPPMFYREDGESRGVWGERAEVAKTICASCPVRLSCEMSAVAAREPEGIWGGFEFPKHWRTPTRRARRAVARAAKAGAVPSVRRAAPAA